MHIWLFRLFISHHGRRRKLVSLQGWRTKGLHMGYEGTFMVGGEEVTLQSQAREGGR